MLLLYAPDFVASLAAFAVMRCQRSARDQSHGQAAWLWPRRRCWAVSMVGANSGMVPCGAVRSVVVAWCALVADFTMKLCTDVWHMIFL
jgi:hypothetical protein